MCACAFGCVTTCDDDVEVMNDSHGGYSPALFYFPMLLILFQEAANISAHGATNRAAKAGMRLLFG